MAYVNFIATGIVFDIQASASHIGLMMAFLKHRRWIISVFDQTPTMNWLYRHNQQVDGHEGMWAWFGSQASIALNWHSSYSGKCYSVTWLYILNMLYILSCETVYPVSDIMVRMLLAATKQLYERSFPSVRPSVTPFSLCSCHCIIIEFSGVITMDKNLCPCKRSSQRSKVKVTEVKANFDDLNPIWVRLLGWWQLWNPSNLPCLVSVADGLLQVSVIFRITRLIALCIVLRWSWPQSRNCHVIAYNWPLPSTHICELNTYNILLNYGYLIAVSQHSWNLLLIESSVTFCIPKWGT